ncbi:MAG: TonB family protein [Halioglobus sp.]
MKDFRLPSIFIVFATLIGCAANAAEKPEPISSSSASVESVSTKSVARTELFDEFEEIISDEADVLRGGLKDVAEMLERCQGYTYGNKGYPENYDQAFVWCTKAAEQGHPVGQSILGALYAKGNSVKQSYRDSLYWFTLAANRKMPHAAYSLFWMYLLGLGTDKDQDTAFMYLNRSADLGYEAAEKFFEIPEGDIMVAPHSEAEVESLKKEHGVAKFAPRYPRRAQYAGVEGYVIVEYCVDRVGRTTNIRVVDSSPERIFDEVSIAAAKRFRYELTLVDGEPVERHGVKNKFTFQLEKKAAIEARSEHSE